MTPAQIVGLIDGEIATTPDENGKPRPPRRRGGFAGRSPAAEPLENIALLVRGQV